MRVARQEPVATESAVQATPKTVEMSVNPQDQFVMPASTTAVAGFFDDVSTNKVQLRGELKPNDQGGFIYPESDARFTTSTAFASVANAVSFTEEVWGRPVKWATGKPKLNVTPDAGEDLNAYYDRGGKGLFFFHKEDPVTHQMVFSGRSGEVTGHEAFHAILDAERPAYLGAWAPDVGAFHESMGDIGALSLALQNPKVLDKVLQESDGDLRKQNCVAALGEELGMAINHVSGKDATGGPWTRNAINSFTWSDPAKLPASAPPGQLSREVHSLSRLWTGATYDILVGITEELRGQGLDARTALQQGGLEILKMQGRLLSPGMAPDGSFKFRDMAKALLQSENELNGGKHSALISKVMQERKILEPSRGFEAEEPLVGSRPVSTELTGDRFGVFAGCRVGTIISGQSLGRAFDGADPAVEELQNHMALLIEAGEILSTVPGQNPQGRDLIKEDGEPYRGVVRWTDGVPSIEPTFIIG